ncbi:RsbRD N-terminal domain-containing protein [Chloroflexota bacterium]
MYHDPVWEQLELKSASIMGKWSQLILGTYPADTVNFLQHERDRFINPVGCIISQETKTIYDELLHGMNLEKLTTSLNEIIRVRSVQDFSPSQAIGFIFLLKQAAREELASEVAGNRISEELLDFESRIDRLALLAFDIYMECREKVYEVRVNEVAAQREMALRILARTNEMDETSEAT